MRKMSILVGALALAVALAGSARASESSPDAFKVGPVAVTKTHAPEMRLDFEVVVAGPIEKVWEVFTTSDGLVSWLAPKANVELKLGGPWEVGFADAAPGGGTVLAYLPMEMIALHAMAPEQFPNVRRDRTIAVFRFDRVSESETRVRLSQIGWKDGPEWDKAFDYLATGNAMLLNMLHHRFAEGPIDWKHPYWEKKAAGGR